MKIVNGGCVNIAILDTGIDISHPLLQAQIASEDCWDFVNNSGNICDEVGHGTHTAYLLTKTAPRARVFCGRVWKKRIEEANTGELIEKVCDLILNHHILLILICYRQSTTQSINGKLIL